MGCPNFFKYHLDASIEDYAKRFGYNTEVLKKVVKGTREYRISRTMSGGNEQIAMRDALLTLDTNNETDVLYGKEVNSKKGINSGKVFDSNGYASILVKEVVRKVFDSNKVYKRKETRNPYKPMPYMEFALREAVSSHLLEQSSAMNTPRQYRETLYKAIAEIFEYMSKNDNEADKEKLLEYFMTLISSHFKNEKGMCSMCGESLGINQSDLCVNCLEFITNIISEKMDIIDLEKLLSRLEEGKIIGNHDSKSLFLVDQAKSDIIHRQILT